MLVCVQACMCTHVEVRGPPFSFCLDKGLELNQAGLASRLASLSNPLCLYLLSPIVGVTSIHYCAWLLTWVLNPQACEVSTLLTEPSYEPLF